MNRADKPQSAGAWFIGSVCNKDYLLSYDQISLLTSKPL